MVLFAGLLAALRGGGAIVEFASAPVAGSARYKAARGRRVAPLGAYDHLVVVAGHSVTMAESLDGVEAEESAWFLLDYQVAHGLPGEFVAHARRGVDVAAADDRALLVFSGGQTRAAAGPRSEAQSYWLIAEHFGWWGSAAVASRATTEESARDSYENLLFSILRFREFAGAYPARITVVSFDFKERRFVELHAPALRWPAHALSYEGVAPGPRFDGAAAAAGEAAAVAAFEADPYGCGGALAAKRAARDPFHRTPPYAVSNPDARALLAHCGPGLIADAPWAPRRDR